MVGEFHRCGAGAAFLAVDDDEVGDDPGLQHGADHAHEFPPVADAELEAHRLAVRQLAQTADELHHLDGRRKLGMRGGGDAVDAHRDAAGLRNLGRDLGGGEHAAMAGFGALAHLHLDHLDLRVGGLFAEFFRVEPTVGRAATEIARSKLPYQVAAAFAVIAADAAFTRIMGEAALLRALVERKDRVGGERAEAHR